jgi:hypothetical protein
MQLLSRNACRRRRIFQTLCSVGVQVMDGEDGGEDPVLVASVLICLYDDSATTAAGADQIWSAAYLGRIRNPST